VSSIINHQEDASISRSLNILSSKLLIIAIRIVFFALNQKVPTAALEMIQCSCGDSSYSYIGAERQLIYDDHKHDNFRADKGLAIPRRAEMMRYR
jgi:hypothetical protein